MRLISQDGRFDIAYEHCILREEQGVIEAIRIKPNTSITMGQYDTPEKVQKAMQMLHECYVGMNMVFRFPQGDEV